MCPPLSDIPATLEMRGQASIDDLIGNHVETSWEIEKCGPFAMMPSCSSLRMLQSI